MIFFGFRVLPEQASTVAVQVDRLYGFLVAVGVFFTVLIAVLIIYFSVRYHRRFAKEKPKPIEGHAVLESIWIGVPLVIVMVIFVWGTVLFFHMFRPPPGGLEVFGVGKQWMWKFQHPEGRREINELHVPTGRPVKVTLTSEDVIHSFFVPAFRIKMDAIPGRYTQTWFEATKPGEYHLFCAEYCGTKHSRMIGKVIVMEPKDYEQWLAGGTVTAGVSMAARGQKLFEKFGCVSCHQDTAGSLGPALKGVFGKEETMADGEIVLVDEAYLRESITVPNKRLLKGYMAVMPTYEGLLSEEQLLQIIAYIKSLKGEST